MICKTSNVLSNYGWCLFLDFYSLTWLIGLNSFTVLGGEDARTGKQGSLARKIATSDLHCVQCDMAVNRWTGKAWASDADYMFFRNTAPDRVR